MRCSLDTDCRVLEKSSGALRSAWVLLSQYSNGDTMAVPGHYGCHCIILVVEVIPTTCALSGSRRKALYRYKDIHHMLNVAKND